jgi:hypothetical protein
MADPHDAILLTAEVSDPLRSNARTSIAAILVLLGTLLSGNCALAADYSVDFDVETDASKDAGTLACVFDQTCEAKMESLGLSVSIYGSRRDAERADVHLYGRDLSCCYFDYATSKIVVDPRKPLSRVTFFKGAAPRGGLFIENEPAGTLYLRFHSR